MGLSSFAGRIKEFFGLKGPLSDELFEDLADLLVEGDFGAGEAFELTERLREQ